jgi:hypothetical protein
MRRVKSSAVAAVLALVGLASSARADIVFTGTNGSNLSASVTFAIDGNNLVITLTNTSLSDVMTSSQVLTAVFFSTPGSLTPVSANVAAGSDVNNPTDAGDDEFPSVGGEWAYKSGLNIGGSSSGISSSGLDDLFGSGDAYFGDVDLDPPQSPNGISYGITSAGDDPTTANGGLVQLEPVGHHERLVPVRHVAGRAEPGGSGAGRDRAPDGRLDRLRVRREEDELGVVFRP